jgi:hypothetical protein
MSFGEIGTSKAGVTVNSMKLELNQDFQASEVNSRGTIGEGKKKGKLRRNKC